uniref:Peptidase S1 domain-containing protein n=1 Tax=Anopheles christyi TaxID=43041 RepID=A0A182KH82_9DIPT
MKHVISFVVLVLFFSNTGLANNKDDIQAEEVSQAGISTSDKTEEGKAIQTGRIVNGTPKDISKYKFMAIVYFDNQFVCGASIISDSHALTAAHCLYDFQNSPSKVTIRAGSTDRTKGGTLFQVVNIAISPSYMTSKIARSIYDYDVAVLTVATNAFSGKKNIAPIPLQTRSDLPADARCYIVGWGRTKFTEDASQTLLYADFKIVSLANCTKAYAGKAVISSNIICATAGKAASCEGDSGGPLVCDNKLTGIISFHYGQCTGILPSGFAKIMAVPNRVFIKNRTGK